MSDVRLKMNRYGIELVMNPDTLFPILLEEIRDKFHSGERFFREADMALTLSGRDLSDAEEAQIIAAIEDASQVNIVCVMEFNTPQEELDREQVLQFEPNPIQDISDQAGFRSAYSMRPGQPSEAAKTLFYSQTEEPDPEDILRNTDLHLQAAKPEETVKQDCIYPGSLGAEDVLERSGDIVVVGDVEVGARIQAGGSIIVLGVLSGSAEAGTSGDASSYVAALEMDPQQLRVADVEFDENLWRLPEKKRRMRRELPEPFKLAVLEDDTPVMRTASSFSLL